MLDRIGILKILFIAVAVAGCATEISDTSERASPLPHRLDANGVQLLDRPLRIDFGRTDHSTISAMTKVLAVGPNGTRDCGGLQEVYWPDGTVLAFEAGNFRGWQKDGAGAGQNCGADS
ncbi:MAG: hypothetical protein ABJ327_01370 [Litoreibacter sp.]